jgi:hypothetical protein
MEKNESKDAMALAAASKLLAELSLDAYMFRARLVAGTLQVDLDLKSAGAWRSLALEARGDGLDGDPASRRETLARWRTLIAAEARAA